MRCNVVAFTAGGKAIEQSQFETAILREMRKAVGCATGDLPARIWSFYYAAPLDLD